MSKSVGTEPRPARKGATKPAEPKEEAIRRRAYELYLARNGAPGNAVDDWLQAEREVGAQAPAAARRRPARAATRAKKTT